MRLFKKRLSARDKREFFREVLEYVSDFDRPEFNKFMEGLQSGWEGWDKFLRTKTKDEKEEEKQAKEDDKLASEDIDRAERILTREKDK